MRIFLTGGSGYLGERLAWGLLGASHEVRALIRHPDRLEPELRDRLEIVQGDLFGEMDLEFFEGVDAVIHSAAMATSWHHNRRLFDLINVESYRRLLDTVREAGIPRILHTSSFIALGPSPDGKPLVEQSPRWGGPPMTEFERTKWEAETVSREFVEHGGPLISLYPCVIYGPGLCTDGNQIGKLAYLIREGRFPGLLGTGRQRWTLAYVEDVVRGHLLALQKGDPGDRFILGGSHVVLAELVAKIQELLGKPTRVRRRPIALGKLVGHIQILRARLGGPTPDLAPGVAEAYRYDWVYSSERACEKLGYSMTPLEDGLAHTVRWVLGLEGWNGGASRRGAS